MRRLLVLVLLAGCEADIASGSYLCGPEGLCPTDEACNGPDNTCVLTSTAQPFTCGATNTDNEPDDTPAEAMAISGLTCVSAPFEKNGCLHMGDPADWVSLAVPSTCVAVEVRASVTFPVAFEPAQIELWDLAANTMVAAGSACPESMSIAVGESGACLKMTVTPGGTYGIVVKPAGGGDCNGNCAYNRYALTVQLATPS